MVAGAALALVLAGRIPPRPRIRRRRLCIVAAKAALLCLSATCEEMVWRWFAIGTLAGRIGPGAALVVSTLGFAFAHVGQAAGAVRVHLFTGSVFGALYLATRSLAAAAAAHGAYNLCILLVLEGERSGRWHGEGARESRA